MGIIGFLFKGQFSCSRYLANPCATLLPPIGGVKAVLGRMKLHSCTPDIKTFSFLLRCLPNDQMAEQTEAYLLSIMKVSLPVCAYIMQYMPLHCVTKVF